MFKRILVPLDLTDKHQPAMAVAAELAGQGNGTATLLHVIEVIPGLGPNEDKDFYERLERTARNHLERLGHDLAQRRVSWQSEVLFGHRAPEIAQYARDQSCDLIVLTAPRLDLANPTAGWGSLSYRVGILAPCPVLLVK